MDFEKILNNANEATAMQEHDIKQNALYEVKQMLCKLANQIVVCPDSEEDDFEDQEALNSDCVISGVYFQGNRTTITWGEDSHTTVGWMENGYLPYSRLIGFAMCVLKAVMTDHERGLSYMEVIKRLYPSVLFEPEYVRKEIEDMCANEEITKEERDWLIKRMNKIEEIYRVFAMHCQCSAKHAISMAIHFKLEEKRSH